MTRRAADSRFFFFFFFFFASNTLQIDLNACATAKEVGGVSSNNGERLGESEGINGIFCRF